MSAAIIHTSPYCPAIVEGDRVGDLLGPATCGHCITDAAWNLARINEITLDTALDRIAAYQVRYGWVKATGDAA